METLEGAVHMLRQPILFTGEYFSGVWIVQIVQIVRIKSFVQIVRISLEGEEKDKGEEGRGLLASGVRAIKV